MRRKFKVISFVISMIIVPCAFSVERDPVETADVIGRDLNVPGLGFLGHVGLWNAQSRKVYEMLDEKDSWGGQIYGYLIRLIILSQDRDTGGRHMRMG